MGFDWGRYATMNTTAKGAYQIEVFEDGQLIEDTGEFDNLITDLALAEGDPFNTGMLCIGTGTTTPLITDVSLEEEIAAKSCTFNTTATITTKGNSRYAKRSVTSSFNGVSGNISEVGFRGGNLNAVRSRSLISDGNGVTTIIPVKPEQTIKISYFVYILIPDVMATGTVTTPYGSSAFTIKSHSDIHSPAGIFAGRFNNPFAGYSLRAILENDSYVESTVFNWVYDAGARTATATVNFLATDEGNRVVHRFQSSIDTNNLPIIELETPLINPLNSDISFTLTFSWNRA